MKVFYAHSATSSRAQTDQEVRMLKDFLTDRTHQKVRVRAGRDDYKHNWKGDWDTWQYGVINRMDMTTRKPVYDIFVVSGTHCGRATANILSLALSVGRPVFWWSGSNPGNLYKVQKIEKEDPEDWTAGWRIVRDQPKQMPLPFEENPMP